MIRMTPIRLALLLILLPEAAGAQDINVCTLERCGLSRSQPLPKIVQITGGDQLLYALDEDGNVWRYGLTLTGYLGWSRLDPPPGVR